MLMVASVSMQSSNSFRRSRAEYATISSSAVDLATFRRNLLTVFRKTREVWAVQVCWAVPARGLARVAKICTNYGQRVQNSVFECIVDQTQYVMLKKQLKDIIDVDKDSVRYYVMGEK